MILPLLDKINEDPAAYFASLVRQRSVPAA
jgi:hypothetical protein